MSTIVLVNKITADESNTLYNEKRTVTSTEDQCSNIVLNNEIRAINLDGVSTIDTVLINGDGTYNVVFTISAVATTLTVTGEFRFSPTATFLASIDTLQVSETNLVDVPMQIFVIGGA